MSERQPYAETQEFAEMVEFLVEEDGVDRREAEVCLQDGDLWPFIDAGSMIPFEGEEAVAQWEDAAKTLHGLAEAAYTGEVFDNPALAQSFSESAIRAREMVKRLKERAGGE